MDDRKKIANILMGMGPSNVPLGVPTPTPRPDIEFENAAKATPWYSAFQTRYGEAPNLYAPEYNLKRAMQLGLKATPDPYDQNFPHWPDQAPNGEMLKSPDHPTVWMQYFMNATGGKNPEALGIKDYQAAKQYVGRDFVPSPVLDAINARALPKLPPLLMPLPRKR